MRRDTERQFRELLEQHDREFLRSVTPSAERTLREQEFDRQFHERTKDVTEPIMTKLSALMQDHGLQSAIVGDRASPSPTARSRRPASRLNSAC